MKIGKNLLDLITQLILLLMLEQTMMETLVEQKN